MTDWLAGCCHPTGGPHGKGEPETCCHVHTEDLPSNQHAQLGESIELPTGWTAQAQALEDQLAQQMSEAAQEEPEHGKRHQHKL